MKKKEADGKFELELGTILSNLVSDFKGETDERNYEE